MFTRKGPLAHGRIVLLDPFVVGEGHVTGFDPCGLSRSAVCHFKSQHLIANAVLFRAVSFPLPWPPAMFKMKAPPFAGVLE